MFFWHSFLVASTISLHPFFISMTDINHNSNARSLEVSVRIFTDDFEKTLRQSCNCKVDLTAPKDKMAMEKQLNTYILNHLRIKVDGQNQPLEFIGYQKEEESTWTYFSIKNVSHFKKIDIVNTLLHDYKEEQINMIHVKANGKELTDKLDFPNSSFSTSF